MQQSKIFIKNHNITTQYLTWFVRITAICLFVWWTFFTIAYLDAVLDWDFRIPFYVKIILFFMLPHLSVWVATMRLGRRFRWILIFPIVALLIFNVAVILGKFYYINILGISIASYSIYLLFTRRLKED